VALSVQGISKSFGGTRALDNVSLTIKPGQVHALIGHNGSGKTTLIKVLAGFYAAEPGGRIEIDGAAFRGGDGQPPDGVRFVHQNLGLVDSLTVVENLALGKQSLVGRAGRLHKGDERRLARSALERIRADLDLDTPVSGLRPAERTAVALARALTDSKSKTRYLVLDEPTAVMPKDDIEHLFRIVREVAASGVGILYVSHHLQEIFRLASVVTVLRNGHGVGTMRISDVTIEQLTTLVVGSETPTSQRGSQSVEQARQRAPLLQVSGLTGARVENASFAVRSGEIVGVAGITGSGREQLLQMVFGGLNRSGTVLVEGRPLPPNEPHTSVLRGLCIVPAERRTEALFEDLTIRENIFPAAPGRSAVARVRHRHQRARADYWLDRLRVTPRDGSALIKNLSGGNQQKVVFARALQLGARVLLLDEPTQGVDVGVREQIHDVIRLVAADGCAVLVASTDDEELERLCTRVLVMSNGRVHTEFAGADIASNALAVSSLGGGEPR
jgi:ribose transport system ATP-binding protein